jgi:rare lipoprotein A
MREQVSYSFNTIAWVCAVLFYGFTVAGFMLHEKEVDKPKPVMYDVTKDVALLSERVLSLESKFKFSSEGVASWYGDIEQGRKTASGEIFDRAGYTAASRLLPLGSFVIVENLSNNNKVVVKVNDRGPYIDGRLIDVSEAAAKLLGFHKKGIEKVRVTVIQFEN